MEIFNKNTDDHIWCWVNYSPKQRFIIIKKYLSLNAEQELQKIFGRTKIFGRNQAEYFADVMMSNSKLLAEQISYKKKELAEMEEELAMYDKYAEQLKGL